MARSPCCARAGWMSTMSYVVVELVTEAKLTRSASMTMCRFLMLEVRSEAAALLGVAYTMCPAVPT